MYKHGAIMDDKIVVRKLWLAWSCDRDRPTPTKYISIATAIDGVH